MDKKKVAEEIFKNMKINREQYETFKGIVSDLDLDVPEKEETWEELFDEN